MICNRTKNVTTLQSTALKFWMIIEFQSQLMKGVFTYMSSVNDIEKKWYYRRSPSLDEYLLYSGDPISACEYQRLDEPVVTLSILRELTLALDYQGILFRVTHWLLEWMKFCTTSLFFCILNTTCFLKF